MDYYVEYESGHRVKFYRNGMPFTDSVVELFITLAVVDVRPN